MLPPKALSSLHKSASWLFAVPAALYTLQNRLVFEALHFISPPEYQLLNNMKLFTTSLVFRVVMKRQLRVFQWLALLLLGLGMALATTPKPGSTTQEASRETAAEGYLAGFDSSMLPWSVVLCNAVLGQSIAFLFRYADSIVKLYAVCAAMALTAILSSIFLSYSLDFHTLGGYLVTFLSMCLYYLPPGRALLQRHGLLSRAHPHAENPVIGGSRRVEKPLRRQRPEKMQLSDRRAKPCTSMNGPTWSAGACVDHC
ncbi:unnamed protein product [Durusdinium trenchii]|uniref:Uncharacterized protein n=1 Tax=Durusdinium trenchii TaxID=1381693 RepID=A0ABP0HY84_9DINO